MRIRRQGPVCGRQLTAALLEADYGVRGWWVPEGHLVPPVTNRANYIHWLEDLLELSSPPGALWLHACVQQGQQ